MAHALLTSTLEKLEGATAAQECAAFAPSRFLEHPDWPTHQRCELDPDLDATPLDLLASCIKIPLHMALARSWVTRIIANHDGGLHGIGYDGMVFAAREAFTAVCAGSVQKAHHQQCLPTVTTGAVAGICQKTQAGAQGLPSADCIRWNFAHARDVRCSGRQPMPTSPTLELRCAEDDA